jgi:hypothetical protein
MGHLGVDSGKSVEGMFDKYADGRIMLPQYKFIAKLRLPWQFHSCQLLGDTILYHGVVSFSQLFLDI